MQTEIVYKGRSNVIDLLLMNDNGPGTPMQVTSLTGVTRMRLTNGMEVDSSNDSTSSIRWNKQDQTTGEISLYLSDMTYAAGYYTPYLVVYDANYPLGIVWGKISLEFRTDAT